MAAQAQRRERVLKAVRGKFPIAAVLSLPTSKQSETR
jgi:hypothetical protein